MLSQMNTHDWNVISSAWAKGIDFVVFKGKSGWTTIDPSLGRFRTKAAAYNAITKAVLAEARDRSSN